MLAFLYNKPDESAKMYEKIGQCYIKLKEFKLALIAFKCQLKIGWIHNNKNIELVAYDNMGMAYFYLNDLDGAKFYHKRMTNGITEPIDSLQRKFCLVNEETIKNAAFVFDSKEQNTDIFNPYFILASKVLSEKNELVLSQFKMIPGDKNTPRLIRNEPLREMSDENLPSPRKTHIIEETKLRENSKIKQSTDVKINTAKSRSILAQLNYLSSIRVFFFLFINIIDARFKGGRLVNENASK